MTTDADIDAIHDWVEGEIRADNLSRIDAAMWEPNWDGIDDDMLLTWLTATLPVKFKLLNRGTWYAEGLRRMGAETMAGLE